MRLWTVLAMVCLGTSVAHATGTVNAEQLRTYGTNSANLVYVFTSPSCPHCAAFHEDIMPTLIKDLADTGRAQIKVVDMGHDIRAIGASKLARCMTNEQYGRFMTDVYHNQSDWAYAPDYEQKLKGYAGKAGLNAKSQERCLSSASLEKTVLEQRNNLAKMYRVRAMPTVVVVQGVKRKTFVGADPKILPEIEALFQK
ncbi:MAG: thioredoxin family protein [Alphaproteobacteria bacterium]|nr:thioredoxin family protein [Alphaproteobacteria bacterium]